MNETSDWDGNGIKSHCHIETEGCQGRVRPLTIRGTEDATCQRQKHEHHQARDDRDHKLMVSFGLATDGFDSLHTILQ